MADYINNVAAGDGYTDACTIGPNFDSKAVVLTIANNPALMQFAVGELGNWRWTDEREYFSIPQSFRVGNVIGVKVRNANPGNVARVLAVLSGDVDPDFQAGTPFTGVLSSSGAITPIGAVTTFRKNTPNDVANTVAPTDLLNTEISIPAGVLTATSVIRFRAWGDWKNASGGNAALPRFQLLLGGTVLIDTGTGATSVTSAVRGPWSIEAMINNQNSLAVQSVSFLLDLIAGGGLTGAASTGFTTGEGVYGDTAAAVAAPGGTTEAGIGYTTAGVNTAVACPLALKVINGVANANYDTLLAGALVEIY